MRKKKMFTNESLATWLKTKDPTEEYNYISNHQCMLAQYFTAMGLKDVSISGENRGHYQLGINRVDFEFPEEWNKLALVSDHADPSRSHTFGAALRRLKRIM